MWLVQSSSRDINCEDPNGYIFTSWWNEYICNQCMSPSWGLYVTNDTHYTTTEGHFFFQHFFFHEFFFSLEIFFHIFFFPNFFFFKFFFPQKMLFWARFFFFFLSLEIIFPIFFFIWEFCLFVLLFFSFFWLSPKKNFRQKKMNPPPKKNEIKAI